MDKSLFKHQVVWLILVAALAYFWSTALIIDNVGDQVYGLKIGGVLLAISFIYHRFVKSDISKLLLWLSGLSITHVLLFYGWNSAFNQYLETHEYRGNIFRGAFYGFRAPYYGHLYVFENGDFKYHWPTLAMSTLFVGFAFYWRKKWSTFNQWPILVSLIALMVFFFGWHEDFHKTLTGANCHYETFAEDLEKFGSTLEIFKMYNQWLPEMSMHNNHYPPGNMLMMRIEQQFIPYFSKISVFLATILALLPLYRLMLHWKFNHSERWITFLVYASNGAILFYPEDAMSPLMLPFSVSAFYFMILAVDQEKNIVSTILFGLTAGIFGFFTFSVFFFLFFCIIYLLILLFRKQINWLQLLRLGFISGGVFVLFFVLVYLIFGFDLIECFKVSLENEKKQMDYSGIADYTRYFITSTGNILAYTGAITPMILGLIIHGAVYRRKTIPAPLKTLMWSLLITLLLFAFCNQFYLEVERIWIFITPFWLLTAGWFLAQFANEGKCLLVFSVIAMSAAVSTYLTLWISFCY